MWVAVWRLLDAGTAHGKAEIARGGGRSSLLLSTGLSLYTLATNGQTAPVIYEGTATSWIASRDDIGNAASLN